MNQKDQEQVISELMVRCWKDEVFKQRLMAQPAATLKAQGVELPAGLKIRVVENTDQEFYLVIPSKPTDLSDEELDLVVGGSLCKPVNTTCTGKG